MVPQPRICTWAAARRTSRSSPARSLTLRQGTYARPSSSRPDALALTHTHTHNLHTRAALCSFTRWGVPQTSVVQRYSNFVSQVDYRTKNPAWVLEHLDERQTESKVASRRSPGARYHEDEGVDERFRAKLAHYRQSGYDRGHMSPAMNNKNSEQAMAESFSLSNMAPQVGKGFNRDYWARFEMFINRTVVPACKDVRVELGRRALARLSHSRHALPATRFPLRSFARCTS